MSQLTEYSDIFKISQCMGKIIFSNNVMVVLTSHNTTKIFSWGSLDKSYLVEIQLIQIEKVKFSNCSSAHKGHGSLSLSL